MKSGERESEGAPRLACHVSWFLFCEVSQAEKMDDCKRRKEVKHRGKILNYTANMNKLNDLSSGEVGII